MKIYKISQKIHPIGTDNISAPEVNWNAMDNYGIWNVETVSKFLSVPADKYIYKGNVNLDVLNPQLVETLNADDATKGLLDEEAKDLYYDDATRILKEYNDSPYYNSKFDEWRDLLVTDYDEEDIMNLAREMLARERQEWGEEDMSSSFKDGYPPIVVTRKSNGTFVINDGNHRVTVWKNQEYDVAPSWINDEFKRARAKNK